MSRVLAIMTLVGAASAKTAWHQLDNAYDFKAYLQEFKKSYSPAERPLRERIFNQNMKNILTHNSRAGTSYKMGVNHLTDRTPEELAALRGHRSDLAHNLLGAHVPTRLAAELDLDMKAELPSVVDWRKKGAVTPVKDQGQCGSCWTFAAAETVESHLFINTGELAILSEQQIASCAQNPDDCGGTGGCQGGTAEIAFASLSTAQTGLSSEWTYPYVSHSGANYACNSSFIKPVAIVPSYTKLATNDQDQLMRAVAQKGPIAISLDASSFHLYESGVFNGCNHTGVDIDHAVQLVGYGVEAGAGYWLVRNSWTPLWGEDGYIRIHRDIGSKPACYLDSNPADGSGCKGGPPTITACGECGILVDSCYPQVQKA